MQAIKNISFKGETSLLKNVQKDEARVSVPTTQNDSFEKSNPLNSSTQKNKLAVGALVVSALGIPASYLLARRGNQKAIKNLQGAVEELTEKLSKMNIEEKVKTAVQEATTNTNVPQKLVSRKTTLTTVLLGIASALGISEFIKENKEKLKEAGYTEDEITGATDIATNIITTSSKSLSTAEQALKLAARSNGSALKTHEKVSVIDTKVSAMDDRINDAQHRANEAHHKAEQALNNNGGNYIRPEMKKFIQNYYGLDIMQTIDWNKKINNKRSEVAMNSVRDAAVKRLDRSATDTLNFIKEYRAKYDDKLSAVWAITAEYIPVKLGGLGDVPADLQDNFTKLGIDNPVFLPMYDTPGVSRFIDEGNGEYRYNYNDKKIYNLRKIATTQIDVFKNGTSAPQKVEFYMSEENGKKLIFVRNDSFRGAIYESTPLADEPEKFAILNKAVYTLAKAKVAEALNEPLSAQAPLEKHEAYEEIKPPITMLLNDWHGAGMAGLLRYRAPLEYNYNEMGEKAFNAMKDMPILMIAHNLKMQGSSVGGNPSAQANNCVAQNIINTLYDRHAMAIVENAHSGLEGEDICNTVLLKRTKEDKQFNSLFHGVALADWLVPVSKNYANEVVKDVNQSGILYSLLQRRKHTGTLEGIVNGTDLIKHDMHKISKNNYVKDLELEIYDKNTPIEEIMAKRTENKRRVYNQFLKPLLTGEKDQPEMLDKTNMITEEQFMNAPTLVFAHRLTDQKGLSLLKGALFQLFDNWDKEFGNKPKPYCIVGGPPESAEEVKYLYELENPDYGTDKTRVDNVIALKGNLPNPALMAASTFFVAPSTFEPCGLTQGECFAKGTPIIATDVGGYHDTVIDSVTGFLAKTPSENDVYEALVRALKLYFNQNELYQQMIINDLNIDFSWARKGKQGSIFEYTDKLGYDRKNLPDIAK